MRKVIIFFLGLFCYYGSIGQGIVNRSSQTMTVQDARWMAQFNMFAPRVADTVAANFSKGIDSCGAIIFTYTDNGVWYRGCSPKRWLRMGSGQVINDTIFTEIPIAVRRGSTGHQIIYFLKERGLISGGVVTLDSCMTLGLNPTVVNIGYKQYSIPVQSGLVVPPADPSNGRIDRIVIDTNLNFIDIPGMPSPTPTAAPYDIFSQFELTQITVPAGATCLMIGQDIIYDENKNTEWVVTTNGNITIDTTNTANPYHLTKAIYVSQYHNGSSIIFTKGSTDTVTVGEIIKMFPYFNGAFPNQMSGQWYHGSTAVSNSISLNQFFNPNDSNRYLNLSAQSSAWNMPVGTVIDKFIITFGGSDTTLTKGLYLDYIQLQQGISNNNIQFTLTTKGTSGASTYDNTTNTLNVPIYSGGSGGGINIYNTDSLLAGPRTVGLNSFPLDFTDGNGTDFHVSPSDGAMEFTSPLGKQLRVSDDANFLTLSYDTNSHLDMVSGKSTLTGNLFLNTVSSGPSTDSILTINSSTGQVNMINASNIGSGTLQQALDKSIAAGITPYMNGHSNTVQIDSATFVSTNDAGGQLGKINNLGGTVSISVDGTVAFGARGGLINVYSNGVTIDPRYYGGTAGFLTIPNIVYSGADSLDILALDTISSNVYRKRIAAGSGSTNSNIGSGFRLAVPGTNNIKTLFNKYGLILDSSSNTNGISFTVDSSLLLTKLRATSLYQPIGTYVTSVSGTSNRITSTGGTTPVIDISASYVGQSSITTLGTVTTGTLSTGAVIGGVTMTLGGDAQGDIYYRNGSGILTRLAAGTTSQKLTGGPTPSWKDSTAVTGQFWGLTGNTGVNLPDTSTTWLGTKNLTPLRFKTNGTGRMIIDSIGRVGIGTTTPAQKLDITGAINLNNSGTPIILSNGSSDLLLGNSVATAQFRLLPFGSDIYFENNLSTGGNIIFRNYVASVATERLRIIPNGNVGIGNSSPTARLQIAAGTATANTAPLKFTSGISLTTAEVGAVEYDGTDLFFTPTGTIRKSIPTSTIGRSTAQTAAVTSVVTETVGAADASYLVSANVLVTTATINSFTATVTYTDEGNTSRTLTLQFSTLAGAFITAMTNAQGTVPYEGVPLHIRAKSGTTITIATTGTFTTVVYNVEGMIQLLK